MTDHATLVDRLLDGSVSAAEQRLWAERCAQDPALREAVCTDWRLQRRVAGLYANQNAAMSWQRIETVLEMIHAKSAEERAFGEVRRRIDSRRSNLRFPERKRIFLAGSVLAACLMVGLLLFSGHKPTHGGEVVQPMGTVVVHRHGQSIPLHTPGFRFQESDLIDVGPDSSAQIALADGTELQLAASSQLAYRGKSDFHLHEGQVSAHVAIRAPSSPLTISTAQDTSSVVGTRFLLHHRDQRTRLDVQEGIVRFTPSDSAEQLLGKDAEAVNPPSAVLKDWQLIWSDDFVVDGPLDPKAWSNETGFIRNQELQWYQRQNAFVDGGRLIIEGRRETVRNPHYQPGANDWRTNRAYAEYTSASIAPVALQAFRYGRLEIRARIDARLGLWPSVWTSGKIGTWPANGEIDIFQSYPLDGQPRIFANASWVSGTAQQPIWQTKIYLQSDLGNLGSAWSSQFHLWKVEWDAAHIVISCDDRILNNINLALANQTDGTNCFRNPAIELGNWIEWG